MVSGCRPEQIYIDGKTTRSSIQTVLCIWTTLEEDLPPIPKAPLYFFLHEFPYQASLLKHLRHQWERQDRSGNQNFERT
jgi:hypothetical protein